MFDVLDFLGINQVLESFKNPQPKKPKEDEFIIKINPAKYIYRPQTFTQYIGQPEAKQKVMSELQLILRGSFSHFLISGNAGFGKTSLAYIIGNSLQVKPYYTIGRSFTKEVLQDFLYMHVKNPGRIHILFIDELFSINYKIATYMLPILEEFKLPTNGAIMEPFICIGSTTDKDKLVKNVKPFVDRFQCQIELQNYSVEDIKNILIQYNQQMFKVEIREEDYILLAENSRNDPRSAIALLRSFTVSKNINRLLKQNNIVKMGLTKNDILIIKYLAEVNKPVGEETLADYLNVERSAYHYIIEPYLIQQGYITKVRGGRIILEKGKQLLKTL